MATNRPLQSVVLTSSATTVTFSGIDQSYTDLVIVVNASHSNATTANMTLVCNGDTASNYTSNRLLGSGSAASAASQGAGFAMVGDIDANTFTSVININNYSNSSNYKHILSKTGNTGAYLGIYSSIWRGSTGTSKEAINSITIGYNGSGTFSAGCTFDLYGISAGSQKAMGGDVVATDGTYWYHAFNYSGTFTPISALSVDVLVVAGGGGGAGMSGGSSCGGGGGGAGGLVYYSSQSLAAYSARPIVVGAGGVGGASGSNNGTNGTDSSFATLTSSVGGGGGGTSGTNGLNGGSGGGAGQGSGGTPRSGGTATAGQGNAGGGSTGLGGAGGGGAGAVGGTTNDNLGRTGGAGINTYSTWHTATRTGASGYVAGGGGGGHSLYGPTSGVAGGAGGGGTSGYYSPNPYGMGNPTPGTANTGGGGGAAGGTNMPGGKGGSGLVIVRYAV
jgi:hypothetical protein